MTNTSSQELLHEALETIHNFEEELNVHLKKFKDLDAFLEKTQHIVKYYFLSQNKIKSFDLFCYYIKEKLQEYTAHYSNPNRTELEHLKRVDTLSRELSLLIYFWEINPYINEVKNLTNEIIKSE